jgi:hypothetical protein
MNITYCNLIDGEAMLVPLSRPQGSRVYGLEFMCNGNARMLAVNHVLKDHNAFYTFITNAASTYLFVGRKNSENTYEKGQYLWKDLLSSQQLKWMEDTEVVILGVMIVIPSKSNPDAFHFIEYIDTFVRGHNIAKRMIREYEEKGLCLIPRDISCNVSYWTKFFQENPDWFYARYKNLYYREVLKDDLDTLLSWSRYEYTLPEEDSSDEDSDWFYTGDKNLYYRGVLKDDLDTLLSWSRYEDTLSDEDSSYEDSE